MRRLPVNAALVGAIFASTLIAAPPVAAAQTFTVTEAAGCGGVGTFQWAVEQVNQGSGDDTIRFTPGLVVTWHTCPKVNGILYGANLTKSTTIVGNGATIRGPQMWVDQNGLINPRGVCPNAFGKVAKWVVSSFGFLQIGTLDAFNTGLVVTIDDLRFEELPSLVRVERSASLVMSNSTASKIASLWESCNTAPVVAAAGANVTLTNTIIKNGDQPGNRKQDFASGAVVAGGSGNLILDRVTFLTNSGAFAVSWGTSGAGTAKIVSSRFDGSGGFSFLGASSEVVNSSLRVTGTSYPTDRVLNYSGSATTTASTFWWEKPYCDGDRELCLIPVFDDTTAMGFGTRNTGTWTFNSTAIGASNNFGQRAGKILFNGTLQDDTTAFTSDDSTWVQSTNAQDDTAITAILPNALTTANGPGLTTYEFANPVQAISPLDPGELMGAVANSNCPAGTKRVINPIDSSCIEFDVLRNPRYNSPSNTRDIGAVQTVEKPHLQVTGTGNEHVDLAWNKPLPPSGTSVSGYIVSYIPSASTSNCAVSTTWPAVVINDDDTLVTSISPLTNGTKYCFRLTAKYASGGLSASSEPVVATPFGPVDAPQVTAQAGIDEVKLFWTEPGSTGGHSTPLAYFVVYRPVGSASWTTGPSFLSGRITTIPGLSGGVTYELGVFAQATDGALGGLGTTTATPLQPPQPPQPPSAPLNVTAVAGNASAVVTWTPPTSSGSFPITNYQVVAGPGGRTCMAVAPATTCEVTGLVNGTTYTFTVRALNGAGWGPFSAPSNAVTPTDHVVTVIVINGSRGTGADVGRVFVRGSSTGLVGQEVTPRVKLQGETEYQTGTGVRTIEPDGTFEWQRKTGKKAYVYFTAGGGVRSNRVIIEHRP